MMNSKMMKKKSHKEKLEKWNFLIFNSFCAVSNLKLLIQSKTIKKQFKKELISMPMFYKLFSINFLIKH